MEKQPNSDLAIYIDHTLLKPTASRDEIKQLCEEAIQYGFFGVCVPPYYVKASKKILHSSFPKVITVIGFPLGYDATSNKLNTIQQAIDEGADELDMVINLAAVKSMDWQYIENEIQEAVKLCHLHSKILKLIIESSLLTYSEIEKICSICVDAKVDFVKTSTGFNGEGATVEIIKQLRTFLPTAMKIKASGGVRTKEQTLSMIKAGADRIGTSSGIKIVQTL